MKFAFAVHGGAWNIPDHLWPAHQAGVAVAYRAGHSILQAGGSAVDAVVAAIQVMEDDPVFDAGLGSFLNEAGEVELDAGLMEGRNLESGAVLGVSRVRSPIAAAHLVMLHSPHCIFTAAGAHQLAEASGLSMVNPEFHIIEREREMSASILSGQSGLLESAWIDQPGDTVGALALDQRGDLAAGNSTGGTRNKAVGRVGDAPLPGLGFYADNQLGAVVCTGWGEAIIRSTMAMHALFALPEVDPDDAARLAVRHMSERVGGFGGLLVMTPDGKTGAAFNTQRMAYLLDSAAGHERR